MGHSNQEKSELILKSISMINEIVLSLGVPIDTCFDEENNSWSLKKGAAEVNVILFTLEGQDYIEVGSPIMKVPGGKEGEFYKKLLEINCTTIGIKFGVEDEQVLLLAQRELEGLDKNEALTMLERIGNFANTMQKELRKEFGS